MLKSYSEKRIFSEHNTLNQIFEERVKNPASKERKSLQEQRKELAVEVDKLQDKLRKFMEKFYDDEDQTNTDEDELSLKRKRRPDSFITLSEIVEVIVYGKSFPQRL